MRLRRCLPLLSLLSVCCLALGISGRVQAQEETRIERYVVELWPDFDDSSVLVIITGAFPRDTLLPATVSIPLPADARINAVARMDAAGVMYDDIGYDLANGAVNLTTPELQFRVEYYTPYEENGLTRSFEYEAPPLSIASLEISVQKPTGASSITTLPTGDASFDAVGLEYVVLPPQTSSSNRPRTVSVSYVMEEDILTSQELGNVSEVLTPPVAETPETNWLLIGVAALGLLVSAYFIGSGVLEWRRTQSSGRRKPTPKRATTKPKPKRTPKPAGAAPAANFCTSCGAKIINPNDKFCRECGEPLRQ